MTSAGYADLSNLAGDLSAASGQSFQSVAQNLIQDAANQVQTFAQAFAPVKTGALKNSIVVELGTMSATVTAASDHAAFVEFGTGTRGEFPGGPIVINAKPGKMLSWVGKDGVRRYAKRVVSQGMAPRPFMRPALERVVSPMANALGDNAVMFIVHGPQDPETLQNAPISKDSAPGLGEGYTLADRGHIIGAVSKASAKSAFYTINAKKAFL